MNNFPPNCNALVAVAFNLTENQTKNTYEQFANCAKIQMFFFLCVKSGLVLKVEESKSEIKEPSDHEWRVSSIVIEEPLSGYI